jgi:hypothetical protein
MYFYLKNFFSDVQVPKHIWKQLEAPFRNIWGQNISLKNPNPYPNPKKKFVDPNPKKMSPDPQHGCNQIWQSAADLKNNFLL